MPITLPRLFSALGLALLIAPAAQAETRFTVSLGGDHLGRLGHTLAAGTRDLSLLLDSTPFGVFDGTYSGRTVEEGATARHSGRTRSTRKSRDVSMRTEAGQLREVALSPAAERTALTDAAAVPGAVLDPVSGFGQLLEAQACPDGLRIYDGRRIGALSAISESREAGQVVCEARYQIEQGPGYLEPIGVTRLTLELRYDVTPTGWQLARMRAHSGIFALSLDRE